MFMVWIFRKFFKTFLTTPLFSFIASIYCLSVLWPIVYVVMACPVPVPALAEQGDDELLIGRLQRQLMSTKTSYKAFARKYQLLRGNMYDSTFLGKLPTDKSVRNLSRTSSCLSTAPRWPLSLPSFAANLTTSPGPVPVLTSISRCSVRA